MRERATATCNRGNRAAPSLARDGAVLDAAIAVTGIFVGRGSGLLGLLAAGPLLACARCGGRATALVAAYAVALCAIVTAVSGAAGNMMATYRFIMVIAAGVVAVFVAVIRGRREGTLIRINDRVQRAILRPLRPNSAAWPLPLIISRRQSRHWSAVTFTTSP